MKIHELKIQPEYFKAIEDGRKQFELRKNDRDYKVGDILVLKELIADYEEYETGEARWFNYRFSGKEIKKKVSYILKGGAFGLHRNYVILGLMGINN